MPEFAEACRILGVVPTIGFEIRLNWNATPLKGKMFNNPDQLSVGYFPVHGVPLTRLDEIDSFLAPIRAAREKRNRKMTKKVDDILKKSGLHLDFDEHVIPVSKWREKALSQNGIFSLPQDCVLSRRVGKARIQ